MTAGGDAPASRIVATLAALAALLAAAAGCSPGIPHEERPPVVEAEFDPSAEPAPKVPSPTDLAYDTAAGRLDPGADEDDSPAQRDLAAYLGSLDGWPASMPAAADFLGELDPDTLAGGAVRVLDITDPAAPFPAGPDLRLFLDEEGTRLRVHPGLLPSWEPGRRYAVAVLGGEGGAAGIHGETVVPSPVFWFFRATKPIVRCDDYDALEGCESLTALVDDGDAADLEEIRRDNAEVFDSLEAAGAPREEIAVAWSFRTSTRTVVPFDPSIDDVHFPNDYYLEEGTVNPDVPPPEGSTPAARAFLARLRALDGYSLTGAPAMRFVGPFDGSKANLTPMTLLFLNADDDADFPLVDRAWDAGRGEVALAPLRALRPRTRYAAVATDYLTDTAGKQIVSSHIWAILRSRNPAADADGRSLLDGVSDEDAADLEEARLEYQELFEGLENKLAFLREQVQAGMVFTTRSVVEEMQRFRALPYETALPTAAAAPGGITDPADIVPPALPRGNLRGVVTGTVATIDLVDPRTREIDDAAGRDAPLPFVMTLPSAPPEGRSGAPIVIFQHDLGGSRMDLLRVADALAAEGLAAIAVDLVGHGDRGVCLSGDDCAGGECVEGTCAGGSLERGADGLPLNAREVFVPADNPFAVQSAFRQQAVDLVALARSIAAPDGPGSIEGAGVDTADVSFLGVGLGATAGTIFMAVDPAVRVAVLSAPAGNLRLLLERSTGFTGAIDGWLGGTLGLAGGTEAHHFFRYCWSWAADPGDGAVYARHLVEAPLPDPRGGGTIEPRELLVQVAGAGGAIPYESQRFFYLSAGPWVYPQVFEEAASGFILDRDDAAGIAARSQAAAFIASGGAATLPAGGGR